MSKPLNLNKSHTPKFNAGDMITGKLTMSDGTKEWRTYMVNRIIEDATYGPMYSLDNGDGWIDSRGICKDIDAEFSR